MSKGGLVSSTLRVVSELETARTPDQLAWRLIDYAGQFGLTEIVTFILPVDGNPAITENILNACPVEFAAALLDDPAIISDALIRHVRKTSAAVGWCDETIWADAPADQQVLKDILEHRGLDGGIIVPAFGSSGLTGLVLMAGTGTEIDDTATGFLKLLGVYCFDRACALQREALRVQYGLSLREFECIKWVAAGKTDWVIGQILSISPKTVNYHVENAKRKMFVPTRVQAVVAAILSGGVRL